MMVYLRTWKCPECEDSVTRSYEELAEAGTPLCTSCGREMKLLPETKMVYLRTWKCPECGNSAAWSYEDLAEAGTPLCTSCDVEMELLPEEDADGTGETIHHVEASQAGSPPPEESDVIDRLVEKAQVGGLEAEDLDEAVHTAAAQMASDTNNGGLEDQVRLLVSLLGVEETRQLLDDLIDDHSG